MNFVSWSYLHVIHDTLYTSYRHGKVSVYYKVVTTLLALHFTVYFVILSICLSSLIFSFTTLVFTVIQSMDLMLSSVVSVWNVWISFCPKTTNINCLLISCQLIKFGYSYLHLLIPSDAFKWRNINNLSWSTLFVAVYHCINNMLINLWADVS